MEIREKQPAVGSLQFTLSETKNSCCQTPNENPHPGILRKCGNDWGYVQAAWMCGKDWI